MAMPDGRMSAWGLARLKRPRSGVYGVSRRVKRRVSASGRSVTTQLVPRFPRFFADQPSRKFVKLQYCFTETITGPNTNAIVVREFHANGMFQPNVAAGGHQPFGFDQLSAQYTHWTVLKSSCRAELQATGYNQPLVGKLSLQTASGVVSSAYAAGGQNALNELPIQSRDVMIGGSCPPPNWRSTATLWCDVAKMVGKKPPEIIGEGELTGDIGANPSKQFFFVWSLCASDNADMRAVVLPWKFTITYYAVFADPKWFTTS